jgi:hypothetical protein
VIIGKEGPCRPSWNQVEMAQDATTRLDTLREKGGNRVSAWPRSHGEIQSYVCDAGVAAHYSAAHFCVIQTCATKNPFEFGRELGIGELVDRNSEVAEVEEVVRSGRKLCF